MAVASFLEGQRGKEPTVNDPQRSSAAAEEISADAVLSPNSIFHITTKAKNSAERPFLVTRCSSFGKNFGQTTRFTAARRDGDVHVQVLPSLAPRGSLMPLAPGLQAAHESGCSSPNQAD